MQWVTREHRHTDRVACPWLIRERVDADAEIVYLPRDDVLSYAEQTGAISFDAETPRVVLGIGGACGCDDAGMRRVEFLWFAGCPGHVPARALLDEVVAAVAPGTPIESIDASDPDVASGHRFPGAATIRVDGQDVDPAYRDAGDYAPRCRLYRTPGGLRPVPPRERIEAALRS